MAAAQTARKRRQVESHLSERVGDGPIYVKSKFLAEDLDLSAREIGSVLGQLADTSTELSVEKWSYTNATTWRIESR